MKGNNVLRLERRALIRKAAKYRAKGYEILARHIERKLGIISPLRPEENIRLNYLDPNPKPLA